MLMSVGLQYFCLIHVLIMLDMETPQKSARDWSLCEPALNQKEH